MYLQFRNWTIFIECLYITNGRRKMSHFYIDHVMVYVQHRFFSWPIDEAVIAFAFKPGTFQYTKNVWKLQKFSLENLHIYAQNLNSCNLKHLYLNWKYLWYQFGSKIQSTNPRVVLVARRCRLCREVLGSNLIPPMRVPI